MVDVLNHLERGRETTRNGPIRLTRTEERRDKLVACMSLAQAIYSIKRYAAVQPEWRWDNWFHWPQNVSSSLKNPLR